MKKFSTRPATANDIPALHRIYAESVRTETASFDLAPITREDRQSWFHAHGERHPILVAELHGKVIGYGSISPFHPKPAYAITGEISVYLDTNFRRMGLGKILVQALIQKARELAFHSLVSLVTTENAASIALHSRLGFRHVGTLEQCGEKFGRLLNVAYFQLSLKTSAKQE